MFLLLLRLDGTTYITRHCNMEDLKREASWVMTDFGIDKFDWIDPKEFDNQCSLDEYPDGTALAIEAFPQKINPKELVDTREDAIRGSALDPMLLEKHLLQKVNEDIDRDYEKLMEGIIAECKLAEELLQKAINEPISYFTDDSFEKIIQKADSVIENAEEVLSKTDEEIIKGLTDKKETYISPFTGQRV